MRRGSLFLFLSLATCHALWIKSKDESTASPGNRRTFAWLKQPGAQSAMLVVAGGLSGAVAKSATAPLERVKIMCQAGDTSNFLKLMADVVRIEGWAGLWRGNTANVIRVIPNKGVLLMWYSAMNTAHSLPCAASASGVSQPDSVRH